MLFSPPLRYESKSAHKCQSGTSSYLAECGSVSRTSLFMWFGGYNSVWEGEGKNRRGELRQGQEQVNEIKSCRKSKLDRRKSALSEYVKHVNGISSIHQYGMEWVFYSVWRVSDFLITHPSYMPISCHIHSHLPIYANRRVKWILQMNRQLCTKNS